MDCNCVQPWVFWSSIGVGTLLILWVTYYLARLSASEEDGVPYR